MRYLPLVCGMMLCSSISAQTIEAIDDKGTVQTINDGQWLQNGDDIYNKNIGNIGVGTNTPTSTLNINGSFSTAITVATSNLTLTEVHYTIILNGDYNITLPSANTCSGRIYVIKNPNDTSPTISSYIGIDGNSYSSIGDNSVLKLQSDGTNWQQTNNVDLGLSVGERVSVHKTMTTYINTHLPSSGLIELDGYIRVGLVGTGSSLLYSPYIQNISGSTIEVTYATGNMGATVENKDAVLVSIANNGYGNIESNNLVYWTNSATEVVKSNVILPNGNWYEIEWFAYQDNSGVKQIYMSALRKF